MIFSSGNSQAMQPEYRVRAMFSLLIKIENVTESTRLISKCGCLAVHARYFGRLSEDILKTKSAFGAPEVYTCPN